MNDNIIIKVTNFDLVLVPQMIDQHGIIGFQCRANASTQKMQGRIDITARFVIPKELSNITLTEQDENLNKLWNNMEFIKATDSYPLNETVEGVNLGAL